MSLSGRKDSSGNRGNSSNGRKRRLSSRSRSSNSSFSTPVNTKQANSSKNSREKLPSLKKRRGSSAESQSSAFPSNFNTDISSLIPCGATDTTTLSGESCSNSAVNSKTNTDMSQVPSPDRTGSGGSPWSNSFKKGAGGTSNHKKPGLGKKVVIKNRKDKHELPQNYEDQSWDKLKVCVQAVFDQKPISYIFEELYHAVENMCSHGMATILYHNLEAECRGHVMSVVSAFQHEGNEGVQFLKIVDRLWTDHCRHMVMIQSIFLFLDRTYAVSNSSLKSIWDMGLDMFGSLVVLCNGIQDRIIDGAIALINKERCHESVNRGLLKNLLGMLADLHMYHDIFEIRFLHETEAMYHAESLGMLRDPEFTLPSYLSHVDKRLVQEKERVLHYLHQGTRKPLILCVEKKLIGEHLKEILQRGFEGLLGSSRYKELSILYNFYIRFKEGQALVCKAFGDFIRKSGVGIVSDSERDKVMVQELLELKTKVADIVVNAFQESLCFYDTVRVSFESVVNKRKNKPAELIAKYLDAQLKSGNKEWSDEELEKLLDNVMVLFRYIHGKDVFEAFYKKDLAKRLLLGKSASFDAEKSMLLKLKQECGPNFTSKLEGMFRDMEISRETMSSFKETRQGTSSVGIELNVNVLTMGYWPPYIPTEVLLPNYMAQYLDNFKKFYISKHNGRKLQWQHSLGQCVLKSYFPLGEKELQVSLFQARVLLLFNTVDVLTFTDIDEQTGIGGDKLRRTLQSLSLGKARVLTKSPKTKEVSDSDQFHYNREFKHKLCRIKINQVQLRETEEENVATNERVFLDRNYQVDAAIVRIMKMRRSLSHNLLFAECLQQLRFHFRATDLKKRIESLIERDYLRRSSDNSSVYEYIA